MLVWNFLKGKTSSEMGSCSGWKLFFPNETLALVRFEEFSVVKAACFCFPDVSTQRLAVWRVARAGLTLSVGFEACCQQELADIECFKL